jgi:hypothetical protein
MQCEEEEDPGCHDTGRQRDPFIDEGLSTASSDSGSDAFDGTHITAGRLGAAKERREQLKRRLFRAKERG